MAIAEEEGGIQWAAEVARWVAVVDLWAQAVAEVVQWDEAAVREVDQEPLHDHQDLGVQGAVALGVVLQAAHGMFLQRMDMVMDITAIMGTQIVGAIMDVGMVMHGQIEETGAGIRIIGATIHGLVHIPIQDGMAIFVQVPIMTHTMMHVFPTHQVGGAIIPGDLLVQRLDLATYRLV